MSIIENAARRLGQLSPARPAATRNAARMHDPAHGPQTRAKRPKRLAVIEPGRLQQTGIAGAGAGTGSESSIIAEEFRSIKRPLLRSVAAALDAPAQATPPMNLVMVTSSIPKEGKTFCAINLALSIAMERDYSVLLADANTRRILLDVNSVTGQRSWDWGLRLDRQSITYSNAPPFDLTRYTAKYRYLLTPRLALEATGGYEDNNYLPLAEDPRGAFGTLGFAWTPSELTTVSALAGHRYFGTTFDLSVRHRANMAVWTVSYDEDVVTQAETPAGTTLSTADFLDQLWKSAVPDDTARKTVVDTFIRNARLPATLTGDIYGLSNRVFLQKYLPVVVALTGVRNTLTLKLYGIRREPLSIPLGTPVVPPSGLSSTDDDYMQLGASALWDYQLSPRSHVITGADYARIRSFTVERVDYERSFRAALSRKLTVRSNASLEVRRQQRTSTQASVDYAENAVSLFILLQL